MASVVDRPGVIGVVAAGSAADRSAVSELAVSGLTLTGSTVPQPRPVDGGVDGEGSVSDAAC